MKTSHLSYQAILAFLFAASTVGAADTSPIALVLKPYTEVSANTLLLKDVIENLDVAGAAFSTDLVLGIAPALGRESAIRRSDVDAILKRTYSRVTWEWSGPDQCLVTRPANEVTEAQVIPMLEEALRKFVSGEGEVHVLQLVNYSPLLIPRQNSFTEIELVSPNTNTRFGQGSLNVENDSRPFIRRNFRFEWEWKRPVWVARSNLPAGPLQPDSFSMEVRNVLSISGEPYFGGSLPTDLVLDHALTRGDTLVRSNIKSAIAVTRGSSVSACIHSGALLVSMRGVAMESGSVGQTIRVQNPNSGKELYGKITHENTVEIIP